MGNKTSDSEPFLFSSRVVSRGSLAYKQTSFRVEQQTKVFRFLWFHSLMPICSRSLRYFILSKCVLLLVQVRCVTSIWPDVDKTEINYNLRLWKTSHYICFMYGDDIYNNVVKLSAVINVLDKM
jgi:hypothetical protein